MGELLAHWVGEFKLFRAGNLVTTVEMEIYPKNSTQMIITLMVSFISAGIGQLFKENPLYLHNISLRANANKRYCLYFVTFVQLCSDLICFSSLFGLSFGDPPFVYTKLKVRIFVARLHFISFDRFVLKRIRKKKLIRIHNILTNGEQANLYFMTEVNHEICINSVATKKRDAHKSK